MTFEIQSLKNGLIVSCQPVKGGVMDNAGMVVGFALAALDGGAAALRIESADYVRAVRQATNRPIIGLVKRDLTTSPVRITPLIEDVDALATAGADVIAYDATQRTRPVETRSLIEHIHAAGKIAMADCSISSDAEQALREGAEIVGSTLAGYTGPIEPTEPDFALIAAMRKLTPFVVAEGCVRTPEQASRALRAGAFTVVVGSAITRPEHVTSWFRAALDETLASSGA
ncbi:MULTISPECIES: putative N-acetylmannosamine-6-phosphate 2-epimerase [unclassified Ensifer]|uniref:N-acetylmannosamine-6-phosphate 2-epimerase n=1 Tax=unclassified Ensifer TaxID=2633371 RepID=UPI0008134391|nr:MULTISPECIES: putative N-acetylmannosamine-6-phosphate 2-epimerase [unclassified Ensifer]OCP15783.1 N-acetylmannosamine-6-phosphate 2-epimerase [Ensifer sp. LC54]OCP26198.1 N-acetylmannosamine-6-phosphate 2-epimerase [Ensifer sp. LC384]OCP38436.1 N-acetylmannosamine-6-phosphate 2-epimerase [Ensifer sp. LC163]